jgi:hypothetical protein
MGLRVVQIGHRKKTTVSKVQLVSVKTSLNCLVRHIKLASFNLGGYGINCWVNPVANT